MDHLIQKRSEQVAREAELSWSSLRDDMGSVSLTKTQGNITAVPTCEQLSQENIVEQKTANLLLVRRSCSEQIARESAKRPRSALAAQEETTRLWRVCVKRLFSWLRPRLRSSVRMRAREEAAQ